MSSLELDANVEPHTKIGNLFRLFDPAFGHFVWALQFLALYIGAGVACVLGLGGASPGARTAFLIGLAPHQQSPHGGQSSRDRPNLGGEPVQSVRMRLAVALQLLLDGECRGRCAS